MAASRSRRIAVVGASGSGKSTVARRLAEDLGVARIDLDELFHRPGWEPTPTPEFRTIVADTLAAADEADDGWVVAGNYLMVADLVHGPADTIVWLDLGRRHTIPRVIRRSARRVATRERLWNGNRETLGDLLHPNRSIVVEAWRTHPLRRAKYEQLASSPLWASSEVHRLRRPSDVERCVASISG